MKMSIKIWWTEYPADEWCPRRVVAEAGLPPAQQARMPVIYETAGGWEWDGTVYPSLSAAQDAAEARLHLIPERRPLSAVVHGRPRREER